MARCHRKRLAVTFNS